MDMSKVSYACSSQSVLQSFLIQGLEWMTGRQCMEMHYARTRDVEGDAFWAVALEQLDVHLRCTPADPSRCLPRMGPAVVVANHPLGVLDGLSLCRLISQVRTDFRILVNHVLCQDDRLRHHFLPVDFSGTQTARRQNVRSLRAAFDGLREGRCLAMFPAGGVATASRPFGPVEELPWKPLLARLVRECEVPVVPVFFEGCNSRLFQLASQVSLTLRLSLLLRETLRKKGETLPVYLGAPIPFDTLAQFEKQEALTRFLRRSTLNLAQK
jgi:putative hemolysin